MLDSSFLVVRTRQSIFSVSSRTFSIVEPAGLSALLRMHHNAEALVLMVYMVRLFFGLLKTMRALRTHSSEARLSQMAFSNQNLGDLIVNLFF